MLADEWVTNMVIAVVAAAGGGLGAWWTRQAKREETHLAHWRALTESQQKQLDSLSKRLDGQVSHSAEQDRKITQVREENRRLSRLLDRAVTTIRDWISWERSGRTGDPPTIPDDLRELL